MLSLTEALAALPGTADDIAAHLLAKGIQGAAGNAEYCPIAHYLTQQGFTGPYVIPEGIDVDDEVRTVVPPDNVAEFINRFDDGEWPELVLDDTADDADQTKTQEPTA